MDEPFWSYAKRMFTVVTIISVVGIALLALGIFALGFVCGAKCAAAPPFKPQGIRYHLGEIRKS